jgi:hypothetical protein
MALEPGRGRSAVPVRSALTGTAVAVAAVVAALVFGASLAWLVDPPRLYGQDWTLGPSLGFGSVPLRDRGELPRSWPVFPGWRPMRAATGGRSVGSSGFPMS